VAQLIPFRCFPYYSTPPPHFYCNDRSSWTTNAMQSRLAGRKPPFFCADSVGLRKLHAASVIYEPPPYVFVILPSSTAISLELLPVHCSTNSCSFCATYPFHLRDVLCHEQVSPAQRPYVLTFTDPHVACQRSTRFRWSCHPCH
jgi:hypothetical protein